MTSSEKLDFFLSRRGSVAHIAREVAEILIKRGYKVRVQDYDIPISADFISAIHDAIKNTRDLVVLFTHDYETSPYTRKEFTSFEADRAQTTEERRIVVLRCEDVPLRGLLASNVYQDLVGVDDPQERERRIIAAAEGQSQSLQRRTIPFVGVPPRVVGFVGRENELDRLDAILVRGNAAAVTQTSNPLPVQTDRVAVQGMGGVGKSSLAAEYAYRYREFYAGVWWCAAQTRLDLLASLSKLGKELGVAASDEPEIAKVAYAALRRLAEQRAVILLVYDNVTDPDEISDLLPVAGAHVLITSRFADFAGWAEEIALDVLPLGEATAFLMRRADRNDEAGATSLAETLGCLPLALDHAAAYCKRTNTTFINYASRAERLIAEAPRGTAYPRSVVTTFNLAIAAATSQCAAAETLMAYLACCAPEPIPMMLVEGAIYNESERDSALLALSELSLIRYDSFDDGTPALTVHRLVQVVARVRAASDLLALLADRLADQLITIYPEDGADNSASWSRCAQLTPHVVILRDFESRAAPIIDGIHTVKRQMLAGAVWANLFDRAGLYFFGRGAYARAEQLFQAALAIRANSLGPEHYEGSKSFENLAAVFYKRGELIEARLLFERVLRMRERVLGADDARTAQSLDNLATVLRDQGELKAARKLHERALAIKEKALGAENIETARTIERLATVLGEEGKFAKSRRLHERALAVHMQVYGPEHGHTAAILGNLAIVLRAKGDLVGALRLHERVLAIREKTLGPEHPETAMAIENVAIVHGDQGDIATSRTLHERALIILESALGPEHPHTTQVLENLSIVLRTHGDRYSARRFDERLLAIRNKKASRVTPTLDRARSRWLNWWR